MVLFVAMFKHFEQHKFFFPTPTTKYYMSIIGIKVFWRFKDLSLNDYVDDTGLPQGGPSINEFNNLEKKQISCLNDGLPQIECLTTFVDADRMENTIHDFFYDNLIGEMSCSFVEGKEGFMRDFGFSSMNKGKNKEDNGYGVEDLLENENLE